MDSPKRGAPATQLGSTLSSVGGGSYGLDAGIDTIYDGAANMMSTTELYGNASSKWATHNTYKSAFGSVTPRPWQRSPTKMERDTNTLQRGPGMYNPYGQTHMLSSSLTSWSSRGRTGPVGFAFDSERASLPFRSSIPRLAYSTTVSPKPPNKMTKEDAFIVRRDACAMGVNRRDFCNTLHLRALPGQWGRPQTHTGSQGAFTSRMF